MSPATETPAYADRTEEAASWFELTAAVAVRGVELCAIAVAMVFIAPPLVILAVIVLVPTIALAAVAGLVALPVLVVRRAHRHRSEHPHRLLRHLTKQPA